MASSTTQPTITQQPSIFQQNRILQESIKQKIDNYISKLPAPPTITTTKPATTTTQRAAAPFIDIPYTNTNNLLVAYETALSDAEKIINLDNPLNFNRVAFDTYNHIQDKRLTEMERQMSEIQSLKRLNTPRPINAIKSMATSNALNIESVSNNNYLIYGNNGCLEYTPNNITDAKWEFKSCNANTSGQQFKLSRINNIDDYNAKITNPINNTYRLNNGDNTLFGFYTVNPNMKDDQCLQLNNDGLTVMPCNMTSAQRFRPMYNNVL